MSNKYARLLLTVTPLLTLAACGSRLGGPLDGGSADGPTTAPSTVTSPPAPSTAPPSAATAGQPAGSTAPAGSSSPITSTGSAPSNNAGPVTGADGCTAISAPAENASAFYAIMPQNVPCYHTGACTYVNGSVAVVVTSNPNWCSDLGAMTMQPGSVDTFAVMLGALPNPNSVSFPLPDPNFKGVGTASVVLAQVQRAAAQTGGQSMCGTGAYNDGEASAVVSMTTAFDANSATTLVATIDASAYPKSNCAAQAPFKVTVRATECPAMVNTFPLESAGVNEVGTYPQFQCVQSK